MRINRKAYFVGLLVHGSLLVLPITLMLRLGIDEYSPIFAVVALAGAVNFVGADITLGIRRLHDLNKSGWYLLLTLVPVINVAFIVYLLFWSGDESANQYGDNPVNASIGEQINWYKD